jgi:glycosyltransferase involved in cell wall biosynthesis
VTRVLVVGGPDVNARIPFMSALGGLGFDMVAAGTARDERFNDAGLGHSFYAPWGRNPIRSMSGLAAVVRETQPEIVHAFDTVPGVLAGLLGRRDKGRKYIRTVTGLGWSHSTDTAMGRALRAGYNLTQRIARPGLRISIFQNADDQQQFVREGLVTGDRSALVLGSGVDLRRFGIPGDTNAHDARASLGIGPGPVVAMASRLLRAKGVDTFIQAAASMPPLPENQRPIFVLAGDADSSRRGAVAKDERFAAADFHYIGPLKEIDKLFRIASVVVLPTRYREGVPRVLIEAAALGKPLVATDMPGCREIVRAGSTGTLVPPDDPRACAAAITDFLLHPHKAAEFGQRAAQVARSEFSLPVIAEQYAQIYRSIV